MPSKYTQERLEQLTATIANGQTISDAISSLGKTLVGLITPAAFTGTIITFQISMDGTTYKTFYNSAGAIATVTVGVDRHIGLVPADFAGARFFKLVSGSSEAAEREITVILRGM